MKELTEEQMEDIVTKNEELNKWCGTQNINYYEGDAAFGYLLQHAVPKLETDGQCSIFLRFCSGKGWTTRGWLCSVQDTTPFRIIGFSPEGVSSPILAFFLAWDEVRKKAEYQIPKYLVVEIET